MQQIVGDVLMAATFVSYAGPFQQKYRLRIAEKLFQYVKEHDIPFSKDYSLQQLLANEATIATWNQQSLPSDSMSVMNGIILTNSTRYPLMIDPQLQGLVWVK